MWKNNLTLPLISLVLAALGALLLALDFGLRHTSPTSTPAATAGGSPTLDGQIAEGEYAHRYHDETTGIDLYWTVLGDQIYFGLRSPGSGWVALALSPSGPVMQGGDIIIGYLSDGLHIQDEYADSPMSHKADTELGGQDDILEAAGSTDDGGTTIEFRRKLDTGDRYDQPITEGEEEVQLAYSDSADFASYHSKRAIVTLQFLGGG
ncbi:MAG: DOMON domain-containing protein [Candidatus Bipolaricaulia bacterium]